MFDFDLQLFGGIGKAVGGLLFGNKGQGSSSSSYVPSPQEQELMNLGLGNAKEINPYIKDLYSKGYTGLANNNVDVDYKGILSGALNQVSGAQAGLGDLTQGKLPAAFQDNMTNSVQSGVDKTVGGTINNLSQRGILNSSVTGGAMNDISKNVSDTMAQQYQNNIGILSNLFGQQIGSAGVGLGLGQAAQQGAAYMPLNFLNAANTMQGTNINGLLGAVGGKGTQTSSETPASGGLLGNYLGTLASGAAKNYADRLFK